MLKGLAHLRRTTAADMSMSRRIAGIFGVDLLIKASGVVLLPAYLALMSQAEFATYGYLTALIGTLSLVLNFGLYVPQSKLFHAVEREQRGSVLKTINLLLASLLVVTLVPLYLFRWDFVLLRWLFPQAIVYERYRYLVPVGIVAAVYAQLISNYWLTKEDVARVQAMNIARLLLGILLVLGVLVWLAGDKAELRLVAFLASEFCVLAVFARTYVGDMRGQANRSTVKSSLALGLPIMISGVLGIAINLGDKYFIGQYCAVSDLSVYFLGLAFASVVSTASMAFHNVWLPIFLKEPNIKTNLARTRSLFWPLLAGLSALSLLIWIVVAVAFEIGLIGQSYGRVLGILPLQLMASMSGGLVGLLSVYTVYWSMTHVTIVVGLIVALASAPLNLLAVTSFGMHGVAAVAVVLNVMYAMMYAVFIRRRAGLEFTAPWGVR